jgi:hypothetical protein
METTSQLPPILFTYPGRQVKVVPAWLKPFSPEVVSESQLGKGKSLNGLTVVLVSRKSAVVGDERSGFVECLARGLQASPKPSKVLFNLGRVALDLEEMRAVLRPFAECGGRASDIEFAHGRAEEAIFAFNEAVAKMLTTGTENASVATSSEIENWIRSKSGRISAKLVAEAFGESVSCVSIAVGKKRQTVSKTPDAPKLQASLMPFERILQLRQVLSELEFKAFLQTPHEQLSGRAPIAIIREGEAGVVADLVDDMLAGMPA